MTHYLVTGGAGFIGSHLSEALLARGDVVTVIDDLSTGRIENIEPLFANPNFCCAVETITNETVLDRLTSECDVIIHLAAAVGVKLVVDSPVHTITTNVNGTEVVLKAALRLFNTVGPRQVGRYGMVMPRFVDAALTGDPLTVYGTGTQSRCFCHVQDVVRAIITLADEPAAAGTLFNIGATEPITILDLARRVIELTQSSSEIIFIPYTQVYPEGFEDMQYRQPDTSRIQALTGWTPERGLDEIILDIAGSLRQESS